MNEDAAEWAAVLILLVWLWCLVVVVPAFLAGRWRGVERAVHASGVVAIGLFVLFWFSLLEGDSDVVGFVVAPIAVLAWVFWFRRRYAEASLALWLAALSLVFGDAAFMVFYGPAPLGVVSGAMALSLAGVRP